MTMRRQKTLNLTAELFAEGLKKMGFNLPEDFTVRGAKFKPFYNTVIFLLESQEFPEVPPAATPEEIEIFG